MENSLRERIAEIINKEILEDIIPEEFGYDEAQKRVRQGAGKILALLTPSIEGEKCQWCKGKGELYVEVDPKSHINPMTCPKCNGTGKQPPSIDQEGRCKNCGGVLQKEGCPVCHEILGSIVGKQPTSEPMEWPKKYTKQEIKEGAEMDLVIGASMNFANGYNEACSDCLIIHQRIVAEKDKEIAELKTIQENIYSNILRMIVGNCDKTHRPSFKEIAELGCPICLQSSNQKYKKALEKIADMQFTYGDEQEEMRTLAKSALSETEEKK